MTSERLMIALAGTTLPAEVAEALDARPVAGVTLFAHHNVESPAQMRKLAAALQTAAPGNGRPPLIATEEALYIRAMSRWNQRALSFGVRRWLAKSTWTRPNRRV
jgi:hypothetical protein